MNFTPPENISKRDFSKKTIFLAGSIEMGKASDWQSDLSDFFVNKGWNVFNPRRKDWDSSWKQEFKDPQFYQQVNWEIDALEKCDVIVLYLDPETMSPISLIEFGMFSDSQKLFVICPEGFWKRGNIEIVCHRKNIPFFESIEDFLKSINEKN